MQFLSDMILATNHFKILVSTAVVKYRYSNNQTHILIRTHKVSNGPKPRRVHRQRTLLNLHLNRLSRDPDLVDESVKFALTHWGHAVYR